MFLIQTVFRIYCLKIIEREQVANTQSKEREKEREKRNKETKKKWKKDETKFKPDKPVFPLFHSITSTCRYNKTISYL